MEDIERARLSQLTEAEAASERGKMSDRGKMKKKKEVEDLPTEIWREIVVRLPAKTVVSFRCVSKPWCSFIDKPDFISSHFSLCNTNCHKSNLLVLEKPNIPSLETRLTRPETIISIRPKDTFKITKSLVWNTKKVFFQGCCDGLLLFVDSFNPHPGPLPILRINNTSPQRRLMLWNPCVTKALVLPPSPPSNVEFGLSFIGFDHTVNDYKVVSFIPDLPNSMAIAIYSLKHHVWRTKTEEFDFPFPVLFYLVNPSNRFRYQTSQGAAHWVLWDRDESATHVFSFDFVTEQFSFLELPGQVDNDNDNDVFRVTFILGKSLAVFGITSTNSFIWVMNSDGGNHSWSLWFSGGSSLDAYNLFKTACYLSIYYDENSGTFLVADSLRRKRMAYNFRTHEIHHLGYYGPRIGYVDRYVDTLLLSKAMEDRTFISFPLETE